MENAIFPSHIISSEHRSVNQRVHVWSPDNGSNLTTQPTELLPEGQKQPDEPSLYLVRNSLDVFDRNLELMSTAVSSTPHVVWQTLQQCPSTSIQSFEASVCVAAQLVRNRNVLDALASSAGAHDSLDWLKHSISAYMKTCTSQGASKGSDQVKVSLCVTMVVWCRWYCCCFCSWGCRRRPLHFPLLGALMPIPLGVGATVDSFFFLSARCRQY